MTMSCDAAMGTPNRGRARASAYVRGHFRRSVELDAASAQLTVDARPGVAVGLASHAREDAALAVQHEMDEAQLVVLDADLRVGLLVLDELDPHRPRTPVVLDHRVATAAVDRVGEQAVLLRAGELDAFPGELGADQ